MDKFDIEQLIWAMSSPDDEFRLNIATGEIRASPSGEPLDDEDGWVYVTDVVGDHDLHDMLAFAEQIDDRRVREEIRRALDGRRPFRAFRDIVCHHPTEIGRLWSPFQEARRTPRVIAWLEDVGAIDDDEARTRLAAAKAALEQVNARIAAHGDSAPAVVLGLEQELQTPGCRADRDRLDRLLAEDFAEIGASGQVWTRDEVIAAVTGESGGPIEVSDAAARRVTDDLVLVTWTSRRDGRAARRTSLWRHRDGEWELAHHQGTPLP